MIKMVIEDKWASTDSILSNSINSSNETPEARNGSNEISLAMNLTVAGLKELLGSKQDVVLDKVKRREGSLKLKLYLVESLISTYIAMIAAESSIAAVDMASGVNQETYKATFISYPVEGTTKAIIWDRL